ncbi:SAM-dependent methyltransferase [Candidatus Pelagibacter communis]|uniref:SAM-dependent methyltransferase n=1 Tax=Pelagibacter ubique TaxID=198252 RepID=UPI00094C399C|nr:SAM-dependent methyltransferase [Candidatus Pelagibacter ubique]|tara:strand:+ start:633 stop:1685 length:1053 start_codon:yes stop_codon:yes gene_type:complete
MILKKKHNIPLDKFINYCLYDKKNGYYMTKNPFGKTGDFITAPNVSRLFSEMLAIWTISFWKSMGSPKRFNLVELGAGNGEMIKVMIESFKKFPTFLKACNILIYEKSPKLSKKQKKNINNEDVKWVKSFNKINKLPSIFIANEFFDAIPVKQYLKKNNTWYEKFVKISSKNKISFTQKKVFIKTLDKKLNFNISQGQNFIEFSPIALKYLDDILKIIKRNKGGLLIIDYGYFEKKMKNTLKAIYKHKFSKILENLGKSDITYHINFYLIDKISKKNFNINTCYTSQRNFLANLGIYHRAEIISKNKSFKEKANIFYRLKKLTDKNEMGEIFKVMLIKNSENKSDIGFQN